VILSGGDPLSLSNRRLAELYAKLSPSGIRTVRIHTRYPIVLPERVDDGLLRLLADAPVRTVIVVHANHANEIDASVAGALSALRSRAACVLNQSVLLRGVNDDVDALCELSLRLFESGVLPYYLHLLDRVAGAAHFEVDAARGRELLAGVRARLAGYLVPRLVRETPGELSKSLIA
jgi:L-lysine 2,3-aminomutase